MANAEIIGYARVSTTEQNIGLQRDALNRAGCTRIFDDHASSVRKRPGLENALSHLRPGDTLIVWKLDRLGRTVKQLVELIDDFKKRGIVFRSLTERIDTSDAAGSLMFHMVAAFAQMERELLIERTHAGLAHARRNGRHGGRKKALSDKKIQRAKNLFAQGLGATEIAKILGVSVPTIYRAVPAEERQIDFAIEKTLN